MNVYMSNNNEARRGAGVKGVMIPERLSRMLEMHFFVYFCCWMLLVGCANKRSGAMQTALMADLCVATTPREYCC